MEIENEGIEDEQLSEQENENKKQRQRGRKHSKKQGWQETVEIFLPQCMTEDIKNQSTKMNKKNKIKSKKQTQMEIENENNINEIKQEGINIIKREQKYERIFELNDYYHEQINEQRLDIQKKNFLNLSQNIYDIMDKKVNETSSNFLNYIQLIVDKSHLDLLHEFNQQLEQEVLNPKEKQSSSSLIIHTIQYSGGNQLFKILTHFKNTIDELINDKINVDNINNNNDDSDDDNEEQNRKKEIIMCLFDGDYNIQKQEMVDLGKFLQEEYEQYSKIFSIVILIPIGQLISVADIQIYPIEFCKSKDLFIKFLIKFLKQEAFPPLSQDILRQMLNDFDLYQITYSEQVRRLKLALTHFLFTHKDNHDLIQQLYQMKESLSDDENNNNNQMINEEEDGKNKNKRKTQKNTIKQNSTTIQKQKIINKNDILMKKREIKTIVSFLEILYRLNFQDGFDNEGDSFSQKILDSNHRLIDLLLNKNIFYIMPSQQQNDFLTTNKNIIEIIKYHLEQCQDDYDFFQHQINIIQNIEEEIRKDQQEFKRKTLTTSKHDRVARSEQMKQIKSINESTEITKQQKLDKIITIIRSIASQLHTVFETFNHNQNNINNNNKNNNNNIPQLQFDHKQFNSMCSPDLLDGIFTHLNSRKVNPTNKSQKEMKEQMSEILNTNTDGMNLIKACSDYGKCINIQQSYNDFKSYVHDAKEDCEQNEIQISYYNAICELRFQGLIEAKRKLKNEFIKHFFAKTTFRQLNISQI